MKWGDYEHYQPIVLGMPSEMSRSKATAEFNHLMAARPERLDALKRLMAINGVQLSQADESISAANHWFVANIAPYAENPKRPDPMWYSIILDLGLFIGDLIIEANRGLQWDMAIWGGKRNSSYQRHVISGFPPAGMNIDFDTTLRIAAYGESLIRGENNSADEFLKLLSRAREMAEARY